MTTPTPADAALLQQMLASAAITDYCDTRDAGAMPTITLQELADQFLDSLPLSNVDFPADWLAGV